MHVDPLGARLRPWEKPYTTSWAAPASILGLGPAIINCPQYKRLPAQTLLVPMPLQPTSGPANNLGLVKFDEPLYKGKDTYADGRSQDLLYPGSSHTLRLASEI